MNDAIIYLNSLGLHKVKPGLERITKILGFLENPQDKVPCLIIAGTNGKGSVASTVASVLGAQGYKTGLYTSPHLTRISERIKINGEEISIDDLYRLILEIKKTSSHLSEEPSYFEVLTAAAFLYFSERKVDFSVLEVGMGGRWDATNVVLPTISVITNISKDHTEFLGESIKQIALEKAGVVKKGVPVITAAKEQALEEIVNIALQKSAPISIMGKDFIVKGGSTEDFSYSGKIWSLDHLYFSLSGLYQLENVSLAIAALESISQFHGIKIDEKHLRKGISSTKWEGRLEVIRKNPPLVLDGAHNPGAASALRKSLQAMFPEMQFVFLLGMLSDKDHENYLKEIAQVAKSIITTNVPSERGITAERLAAIAKRHVEKIQVKSNLKEAFEDLKNLISPVCVSGSLYLIGAIKKIIKDVNST
ncbi:MAG: bifunctional folylpolyglutamate synthase/dihydrofolate synthase [Deltaproteobacteria bacterium]|nr:bifunctional folylpolyglutamate synthase/dihydrofolate synthase [Deltaproteobacteria bacterium]